MILSRAWYLILALITGARPGDHPTEGAARDLAT